VKTKNRDRIDAVDADLLWSAACTAYRLNEGYLKQPDMIGDQVIRPANREVVRRVLENTSMITDADREQAQQMRRFMSASVTLQALRTELSEWAKITAKVCELDTVDSNYALSVITAMPHSYAKTLKKESVDARLARCQNTIGKLGDKVELSVEIVRNNYSAKFNTWFVSAITDDNYAVFFAYRENIQTETHVTIRGTVKRHADRSTQLNRVKVIETKEVL
jgi:hypothetical protein